MPGPRHRFGAGLPAVRPSALERRLDPLAPSIPTASASSRRRCSRGRADDAGRRARARSTMPARGSRPAFVTSSFARQIAEIEAAGASRSCSSAIWMRGATSPTCATRSGPTRRWSSADGRTALQRLPRRRLSGRRPARWLIGTGAGAGQGAAGSGAPAAERQPVVLGDPARLSADTGWTPRIPIDQTLRICSTTGGRRVRGLMRRDDAFSEDTRQSVHIALGRLRAPAALLHWFRRSSSRHRWRSRSTSRCCGSSRACSSSGRGERQRRLTSGIVLYPLVVLAAAAHAAGAARTSWRPRGASSRPVTARPRWSGRRYPGADARGTAEVAWAAALALAVCGGAAGVFLAWWCRRHGHPAAYCWFFVVRADCSPRSSRRRSRRSRSRSTTTSRCRHGGGGAVGDLARQRRPGRGRAGDHARWLRARWPSVAERRSWRPPGTAPGRCRSSGAVVGAAARHDHLRVRPAGRAGSLLLADFRRRGDHLAPRAGAQDAARHRRGTRRTARRGQRHRQHRRGRGRRRCWRAVRTPTDPATARVRRRAGRRRAATRSPARSARPGDDARSGRRRCGRVPPGTSGAMSLEGTLAGIGGAAGARRVRRVALGLIPLRRLLVVVVAARRPARWSRACSARRSKRAGVLNNDVLNFINTAMRRRTSRSRWRRLYAGVQSRRALWLELSRPFTLVAPALGFVSGAVTAAGAAPREPWTPALLVYPADRRADGGGAQRRQQRAEPDLRPRDRSRQQAAAAAAQRPAVDRARRGSSPGSPTPSRWCSPGWSRPAAGTNASGSSLVATIVTFVYSVPPLRTKQRGIWANVTIAIPRGVLLKVAGWSCGEDGRGRRAVVHRRHLRPVPARRLDDQGLRRHGGRRARRLPDAADRLRRPPRRVDDLAVVRPAVPADLDRRVGRHPHRQLLLLQALAVVHDGSTASTSAT